MELRRGVVCYAPAPGVDEELERAVLELFGRLGSVVEVEERHMELAMALMSCAPAYLALVAQAQIDGASRRGMGAETAARLVIDTYLERLEAGELTAAADCFSHDVLYSHPPYTDGGERVWPRPDQESSRD